MKILHYIVSSLVVLLIVAASSQDNDVINRIINRFTEFTSSRSQEKVYLHTDSDVYAAGELIWMNARVLDATMHTPAEKSKVVHVQLISKNQEVLFHKKLRVDSRGAAAGDILLPDSLSTGSYLLRAFSLWMKNVPEGFTYEKEVYVFNQTEEDDSVSLVEAKPTVQLFPEGGRLLQSMENRVAFKVTGPDGKGRSAKGYLLDDRRDTVTSFSTYRYGMGSFTFSPRKNRSYEAILIYGEDTLSYPMPTAEGEGVNMIANTSDPNMIRIAVHSSRKIIGENDKLYVLVHTRGKVGFVAVAGAFDRYELNIPWDRLLKGVNHLTVFDKEGRPLAERLIFKPPVDDSPLQIQGLQKQYGRRERVNLQLSSTTMEETSLTISVHDRQPVSPHAIDNYLLLSSDLKGYIEDPAYYLQQTDSAKAASDLLMMTHGWSRYTWEEVYKNEAAKDLLPAETTGPVMSGKLINQATGQPVKDTLLILSTYNPNPNFVFLNPRKNAEFTFYLPELYDTDVLAVNPSVPGTIEGYRLQLSGYAENADEYIPRLHSSEVSFFDNEKRMVEERIMENYRLYDPSVYGLSQPVVKRDTFASSQMLDEVKFELYPDKFVQLNDVREMVFELLPTVRIKKKKGVDKFYVMNETIAQAYQDNTWYEYEQLDLNKEPATLFINGVPVHDHSVAFNMDYKDIYKVEVYNQKTFTGVDYTFHGAIAITTKELLNGNSAFGALNSNEARVKGYSLQREYYVPTQEEQNLISKRKPDIRHLLYWSPNTVIAEGGTQTIAFQTSQIEGDFYLRVEGITAEGQPIAETRMFTVKK